MSAIAASVSPIRACPPSANWATIYSVTTWPAADRPRAPVRRRRHLCACPGAGLWWLTPLIVFLIFVAVVTVAHDVVHGTLG